MNTGTQLQTIVGTTSRYSRLATAIVIVTVLSMVLISSSQNAFAQSPLPAETIAGRVFLNTADADFPTDVEVVLTITDPDGSVLEEIVKIPEADGVFDFSEVERNEFDVYTIFIEYGGIARTVHIEELETTNNIRLDIWESTDSLDSIKVGTHSTALQYLPDQTGTVGVLELIIIRNDSDRTFLLPSDALILQMPRFGISKNFKDLRVESNLPSGGVWNGENEFAISNAMPPGEYQIMASYSVDYVGDALDFSRPMPLGAEIVRFLIPPDMGKITGTGLSATDPTNLGGQEYSVFAGSEYPKGSDMGITLSGLQGGSSSTSNDLVSTGIPAAIGIAGLALLFYAFVVRRRRSKTTTESAGAQTRSGIITQIADLDDLHDSGEISDQEYNSQRLELVESVENATDNAEAPSSRSDIVAQIAELDELHDSRKINDTEHKLRRQELVEQAIELSDNA